MSTSPQNELPIPAGITAAVTHVMAEQVFGMQTLITAAPFVVGVEYTSLWLWWESEQARTLGAVFSLHCILKCYNNQQILDHAGRLAVWPQMRKRPD